MQVESACIVFGYLHPQRVNVSMLGDEGQPKLVKRIRLELEVFQCHFASKQAQLKLVSSDAFHIVSQHAHQHLRRGRDGWVRVRSPKRGGDEPSPRGGCVHTVRASKHANKRTRSNSVFNIVLLWCVERGLCYVWSEAMACAWWCEMHCWCSLGSSSVKIAPRTAPLTTILSRQIFNNVFNVSPLVKLRLLLLVAQVARRIRDVMHLSAQCLLSLVSSFLLLLLLMLLLMLVVVAEALQVVAVSLPVVQQLKLRLLWMLLLL